MDSIPKEALFIISLNLIPRYLALVCKFYELIYDEFWYYQYLICRYDEAEIIGTDFTYRELCERSLLEGDIYRYGFGNNRHDYTKILIRGIKSIFKNGKNYVLKFNGDLYECDNTNSSLIESNIIDIISDAYIKKSVLYFLLDNEYQARHFDNLSQIYNLQNIYGTTNYQFHTSEAIYFLDSEFKIEKFIIDDGIYKVYSFINKISNMIMTLILSNMNTLLIYDNKNFTTKTQIIYNVTDLGQNYICINKKYYYFNSLAVRFSYYFISRNAAFSNYWSIPHNITFNDCFIPLDLTIKSSVCTFSHYDLFLSEKKIVIIDTFGKIQNMKDGQDPIKRLMGDSNGTYVIKD